MKLALRSMSYKAVSIAALIVMSAGCASPPAVQVTATIEAPVTRTTLATSTSAATSTDIPATLTPASTATQAPVATETSIPATLTPEADPNVNPFTGLPIDAAANIVIPLLVKVSNSPEVRPQTGLALADVVVEHYAEGGITRFTALFHTNAPLKVGSVRSCRLIDIELPVIFGAGIVCSGSSGGTRQEIKKSISWANSNGDIKKTVWMVSDLGTFECMQQAGCKLPMFRTPDRYPPHNLFANTLNAWKELDARGLNKPTTFNTWTFSNSAPDGGTSVKAVNIPYTSGNVKWVFDPNSGLWTRSIGGRPHTDTTTGKALSASNVMVLFANHITTLIIEDVGGSHAIQIQLWGEGPLWFFRDGKKIEGKWLRTGNAGGLTFVDKNGQVIPLKPGQSWLEMAPLTMAVKTS
jgi:Protein of unknown function (DUF3048) N-terminal domain/Protein of unknown function (DUF3048) C-terminal domain